MQTKFCSVVKLSATLFLAISTVTAAPGAPALRTIYETQKLTDPDGERGDSFGTAVSVSGNLAIVGAPSDDNGTNGGSAFIFSFDGTGWNEQAKLTSPDGKMFGNAVAISGNMVLVGDPADGAPGPWSGAVYVFTFDGTAWT